MKRIVLAAMFAVGCGSGGDDSIGDSGSATDAGTTDSGVRADAGTPDAGDARLDGFGAITGSCGEIDDELTTATFATFANGIDFMMDPYDDADMALLTEGGREIIRDGNAGGSSLLSEVFSYEVLARCENAGLLATETEVQYTDSMGKITDLVVEIDGERIGVSVTRAVTFPRDAPYPVDDAEMLLTRKLSDVIASSANVVLAEAWQKQILHVIAYSDDHATSVFTAYDRIDPSTKSDTLLVVTVSHGDDDFLY